MTSSGYQLRGGEGGFRNPHADRKKGLLRPAQTLSAAAANEPHTGERIHPAASERIALSPIRFSAGRVIGCWRTLLLALLVATSSHLCAGLSMAGTGNKHTDDPADPGNPIVDKGPPLVRFTSPAATEIFRGETADLRWMASDDGRVVSVDLYLSREGPGGTFTPLAMGLPNRGSFPWLVQGRKSDNVAFKIVAHDADGDTAVDLTDLPMAIHDATPVKVISLRSDSASGDGPPISSTVWKDLTHKHNAMLWGFMGTPASGWKGNGTYPAPYRLEFGNEDQGAENRVLIPGGSVPELQGQTPVTAEVWFRTSFNGPSDDYEYILEWVEHPAPVYDPEYEGRGMSIMVQHGMLQVYANPWIEVGAVAPNTWYHVAVAKDPDEIRIWVNGQRVHSGWKSHLGVQESPIVLGCSTFRTFEGYTGSAIYRERFKGAIGQVSIWRGMLNDSEALASFETDSARYLPNVPPPVPTRAAVYRADSATGYGPYPEGSHWFRWADLAGGDNDATLSGFDSTPTSGWVGDGTDASPYRLQFDGVDDHVSIPVGGLPQLACVSAVTAEAWIQTGPDVSPDAYHYVMEWIEGFGSSAGMSIAIHDGWLETYLATPYWTRIAPVAPNTWYHVAITKEPGQVRVYLNGDRVYTGILPNIGDANTEVVFGASSWRGVGQYGDFFDGAMKEIAIWQGALDDLGIHSHFAGEFSDLALIPASVAPRAEFALHGSRPNPARDLNIAFALPSGAPAKLELFDVAGRRLDSRDVGNLGAGPHLVDIGGTRILPAGHYVVRLTQGARSLSTKVTVVQ